MIAKVAYDQKASSLARPTIRRMTFRIRTFEQAEKLSRMLSLACPETDRVALGVFELLANAIEHGNLEITAVEKQGLIGKGQYQTEISRRLALPEYKDRYVAVTFQRESDRAWFMIEDQGPGFDHHDYMQVDLSANQTCSGRGIALVRATVFDSLTYLGRGNKLMAMIKCATG